MVRITALNKYLPERVVKNDELEEIVGHEFISIGTLNRLFGIKERRFAEKSQQVSDLACEAAKPIVVGQEEKIDLLIFSAACADLIEPATANIIQTKLGLECPCMDIKNACNSVLSAIHTATAFIESGIYKKILIVSGEKLSDAINLELKDKDQLIRGLASLSLGDGAVALLLEKSADESGFVYQKFMTHGNHWSLCTILGGGSMFPHDVTKNYFEGKTSAMRSVFVEEASPFFNACFDESPWEKDEIDHLITHQVSNGSFQTLSKCINVPMDKNISVFEKYGNVASASVPLALIESVESGKIQKGDKVALIGMAAGISASVQLMIW